MALGLSCRQAAGAVCALLHAGRSQMDERPQEANGEQAGKQGVQGRRSKRFFLVW